MSLRSKTALAAERDTSSALAEDALVTMLASTAMVLGTAGLIWILIVIRWSLGG